MATTIRQRDGVAILEPSGKIMGSSVSELPRRYHVTDRCV